MAWLRSGRAAQQAFCAEVFVYVGPVDSISAAGDLPTGTLRRGCVQEARVPCERHRDRASIHQVHRQRILGEPHVCHSFIGCHYRSPPAFILEACCEGARLPRRNLSPKLSSREARAELARSARRGILVSQLLPIPSGNTFARFRCRGHVCTKIPRDALDRSRSFALLGMTIQ